MQITSFANGTVRYVPGHPAVDASVETKVVGNVTTNIHHSAVEAVPNHFMVNFSIRYTHESSGRVLHDFLTLDVAVPRDGQGQTYAQVETAGAEQLPAVLRSLADAVEADLDRAAQQQADRDAPQPPK